MLDFTSLFVEEVVAAKCIERELEAADVALVRRIRAGERGERDDASYGASPSAGPVALPEPHPVKSQAA